MKRFTALLLLAGALLRAGAQETLAELVPKDPRTMGMGGAFVAMSEGYQSLFGNPAAFAAPKGQLTVAALNPWTYVSPTTHNLDLLSTVTEGDGQDMFNAISELMTTNGFGVGASAGVAWVGGGLGLGMVTTFDSYIRGKNALGAQGTVDGQINGVVGLGFAPVDLDGLRLSVGGDLRPFMRFRGPLSTMQLIGLLGGGEEGQTPEKILADMPVLVGYSLSMDLGARLDLGRLLSVGLAIRDISTGLMLKPSTLGELLGMASTPSAGAEEEVSMLPNITLGASLRPIPTSLGSLLDLLLVVELQDPVRVVREKLSPWQLLHAGAELKMLGGLLSGRAGVNKGWLSLGFGLDILIFEANVAVFTEELGSKPGNQPRTGVSVDFAIRL